MQAEVRHNPDFGGHPRPVRSAWRAGHRRGGRDGRARHRDHDGDEHARRARQRPQAQAARRRELSSRTPSPHRSPAVAVDRPRARGRGPEIDLQPGMELFLQSGAYLASTPGGQLDTKWQGAKGFFSGEGLFLLARLRPGAALVFELRRDPHRRHRAAVPRLHLRHHAHGRLHPGADQYSVNKVGGLKSLFLSARAWCATSRARGGSGCRPATRALSPPSSSLSDPSSGAPAEPATLSPRVVFDAGGARRRRGVQARGTAAVAAPRGRRDPRGRRGMGSRSVDVLGGRRLVRVSGSFATRRAPEFSDSTRSLLERPDRAGSSRSRTTRANVPRSISRSASTRSAAARRTTSA
jgi:hypothetical protein